MARAFIMVEVDSVGSEAVCETITGLSHALEAHVVAGEFDVIAEAEAESVYEVIHSAANEIRALDGVLDTKTYICLE